MKVMYANAIPMGEPFDKAKCIKGKLKLLDDMYITLTRSEMKVLDTLNTPREIEKFIRIIIRNRWN